MPTIKGYILSALLVLGTCVAAAAHSGSIRETVPGCHGEIDWGDQVLEATGSGVRPPDAVSPAQARLLAKRAAVADAYRNLAQLISEVSVTGDTTVQRFITTNDTVRLRVQAYIRGARVVDEKDDPDGTYTVTLRVGMAGRRALTGLILPQVLPANPQPPAARPEPPLRLPDVRPDLPPLLEPDLLTPAGARGPFTSLIIDARGFDVQPAMSPRIYDPAGQEIYGTMNVDPGYAEEVGIAGYMGTIRAAMAMPRAGKRPLVVRAVGTPDAFHRYVSLSADDAQRALDESRHGRYLERCAVILVVDERRARDEAQ